MHNNATGAATLAQHSVEATGGTETAERENADAAQDWHDNSEDDDSEISWQ